MRSALPTLGMKAPKADSKVELELVGLPNTPPGLLTDTVCQYFPVNAVLHLSHRNTLLFFFSKSTFPKGPLNLHKFICSHHVNLFLSNGFQLWICSGIEKYFASHPLGHVFNFSLPEE